MQKFITKLFRGLLLWVILIVASVPAVVILFFCDANPKITLALSLFFVSMGLLMGLRAQLRMGISQWIDSMRIISGGTFDRNKKEDEELYHQKQDNYFLVLGVAYVACGTIINTLVQLLS